MSRDNVKEFFDSISDSWDNAADDFNIIDNLLEEVDIKEGMNVLDVACGKGVITPRLYDLSKKKVLAIDISPKMIEGAKKKYDKNKNYEFICGDFLKYPFKKRFDYVIIYNAYPHFLDEEKLKNKAYEVLCDKGKLVIMHSLGRKKLNEHHSSVLMISRLVDSADNEAMKYSDKFNVVKTIDEDDRYLIILEKK